MPTTPVAGTPLWLQGLALIRGAPVPVVDLARLLGLVTVPTTRLVSIRTERGNIALAVEQVHGIHSIASNSLQTLPPLLQNTDADVIASVGALDMQLLLVLQTTRLLPERLWQILALETKGT